MKISAVINTHNEEKNLPRCLQSIQNIVDEIVVVDMQSADNTKKIAKEFKARVFSHDYTGYVEPARNYAIDKAKGKWILLLDADEVANSNLLNKLMKLAKDGTYDFIRIPRKNIIFGKWIRHTGWWPDYQIRFFRKGAVSWGDEIHSIPITEGKGFDLMPNEENAFTHYNYQMVSQYIKRLDRYTTIEAKQIINENVNFDWKDIIRKPAREFFGRFFQYEGYKDGLHGLVLSLLQAFSVFVVCLKVWEEKKFEKIQTRTFLDNVSYETRQIYKDFTFWSFYKKANVSKGLKKSFFKIRSRLRI